ncbi:hypothetical protein [Acidisphaera sp. S103]|uniref:hypothetical protein n=1 Tax=Acidisphaera sp. S103 TaxID=1747223 RepID=UPI00352EC8AF
MGALSDVHVPQRRNYLRATGNMFGFRIIFGQPKVEIRRITAQACLRNKPPSSPLIPLHPP